MNPIIFLLARADYYYKIVTLAMREYTIICTRISDIKFTCYHPIVCAAVNSYAGCARFNHIIARALLNRHHYIVRASFVNACKYEIRLFDRSIKRTYTLNRVALILCISLIIKYDDEGNVVLILSLHPREQ